MYCVDWLTGYLAQPYFVHLSFSNSEMSNTVGAVSCLKWTPDGTALAMAWKKGGFSLWSVFGSLLVCTVGGDFW